MQPPSKFNSTLSIRATVLIIGYYSSLSKINRRRGKPFACGATPGEEILLGNLKKRGGAFASRREDTSVLLKNYL